MEKQSSGLLLLLLVGYFGWCAVKSGTSWTWTPWKPAVVARPQIAAPRPQAPNPQWGSLGNIGEAHQIAPALSPNHMPVFVINP